MSRRHEHRRAARRTATRQPIVSEHGRQFFTIDRTGHPLRPIPFGPFTEQFPADVTEYAVAAGCAEVGAVASWATKAYDEIVNGPRNLWTPGDSHSPAAVVGCACEHIRLPTVEALHLGDPDLLAQFDLHPTWWLCWIITPLQPERLTP